MNGTGPCGLQDNFHWIRLSLDVDVADVGMRQTLQCGSVFEWHGPRSANPPRLGQNRMSSLPGSHLQTVLPAYFWACRLSVLWTNWVLPLSFPIAPTIQAFSGVVSSEARIRAANGRLTPDSITRDLIWRIGRVGRYRDRIRISNQDGILFTENVVQGLAFELSYCAQKKQKGKEALCLSENLELPGERQQEFPFPISGPRSTGPVFDPIQVVRI